MTKKEVESVLAFGSSHLWYFEGAPLGITRFQAFLAIRHLLKGKMYWRALREAYNSSDNLYYYRIDVRRAFYKEEPFREYLMDSKERKSLLKLPEKITIYRGMTDKEYRSREYGISWSLDRKVAEFFCSYNRNGDTSHLKKRICKKMIYKKDVIAYLNGRSEDEIIYLSESKYDFLTVDGLTLKRILRPKISRGTFENLSNCI